MHLLHNQTYPLYNPVKTSWVYQYDATNSTFVTNYYNGAFTEYPKVGSYMLKQLGDPTVTYASYKNSIAIAWDQYTVEGWVNVTRQATTEYPNRITIGDPSTGNYAILSLIPYHTTPLDWLIDFAIYQGGSVVWSSSGSNVVLSNNWVYYTMIKQSPSRRFFMLNGTTIWSDTTTTLNETFDTTTGKALSFGRTLGFQPTVNTVWDMTRISNIARYDPTLTFTPPTTMFVNDTNTWYLTSFENTWTPAPSPN